MSNPDNNQRLKLEMNGGGKCPNGMIERVGYNFKRKTSKKKIMVKSVCIKDKGKPGKGPKLDILPEKDIGILSNYGYSLHDTHEERVKALKRAMKHNKELKILRHVNALRTLFKSNEKYYNKLDKDLKWIQSHYEKK
jgi:hypothetical protein